MTQQNLVMHSEIHVVLIHVHEESIHEWFIVFSVALTESQYLPRWNCNHKYNLRRC